MYRDPKELAKFHLDLIGKPVHPINPFEAFDDLEKEIAKYDFYKKRGRDTLGRERDEDKPDFFNDPLFEPHQYQKLYEPWSKDADAMLMYLRCDKKEYD